MTYHYKAYVVGSVDGLRITQAIYIHDSLIS